MMKFRELLFGLGFRPRLRKYGVEIVEFMVDDRRLRRAQWLHPKESDKTPKQSEIDALREFLRPGDTAIDIGAHSGDTTLPMAIAVGAEGTVIALEPNPHVFKALQAQVGLNDDIGRIVAYPYAAMDDDGDYEFSYGDPGYCNGGYEGATHAWKMRAFFKLRVQGRNLARLLAANHESLLTRLRYVKIDTEGHDFAVFRSIEALLRRHRPVLRVEVNRFMPIEERRAFDAALRAAGYRPHRVDPASDRAAEEVTDSTLTDVTHFDICALPAVESSVTRQARQRKASAMLANRV